MDQPQKVVASVSTNGESPSPKSYLSPQYKIYCEDDYFAEESSKCYYPRCDLKRQGAPSPLPFDYPRFSQFLQLKSQIELKNLMTVQRQGMVFQLAYYTDSTLKGELFRIYGEMDERSERFKIIFENYKLQRLEQLNEWQEAWKAQRQKECEEEEDEEEGDEEEGDDDDDGRNRRSRSRHQMGETIDEEEERLKYFSPEEIYQFSSLSEGSSSSIEPFLLPRKRDPKANTNTPHLRNRNHAKIAAEAVSRIAKEHPLGLKIDIFFEKCLDELRLKDYRGPSITPDLLRRPPLAEIVCMEMYNESDLIFPSELRPWLAPNPLQILRNLKHKMLAILNLSYGILGVNECVHLLNKIFHVEQFDFHDWGFQTEGEFVKDVFEKWKTINVEVVELTINQAPASYLAVVNKKSKKLIEEKLAIKQSQPLEYSNQPKKGKSAMPQIDKGLPKIRAMTPTSSQNASKPGTSSPWNKTIQPQNVASPPLINYDPGATSIDRKFVQPGDILYREAEGVKAGSQMGCVVALVNSPTSFFLVRQGKWKDLNSKLFHKLRDYWLANPTAEPPHPRFLQKNYICMARTENEEELEVYRVVILGKPDPLNYQVYCVDYGDLLKVKQEQLRYMPGEFLHFMEAQAISCSLFNVASPKKDPTTGNDIWGKDVCDFTRDLFLPKDKDVPLVKVHFKQRMSANGKWLVKVSYGAPNSTMDFGEEIMKFVEEEKAKHNT